MSENGRTRLRDNHYKMNFNVWNIKDILSIPSGTRATKSSSLTNNQNDYSSLSDSQFLFGSQLCPESSETLSAPLDFGVHLRDPKQLQKNSLDSETSIFTKYQTKPQLFGENTKDGGLFTLPLSAGKSKGLLEQFEEKKKKTKEKCDSETLYNFISHVKESIHKLQTSVEKSEEHLSSRSQSVLNSLETVAKTLQETTQAQSDLVLETVQDKGNMDQAILEMQKIFEARQAEFIEMKSNLKHLEVLVAQQSKNLQQLYEQLGQLNVPSVLAELKKLISEPCVLRHLKDSTSQTSPLLAQRLSFTRQDKYTSEEPALGQAQALPTAQNLRMGSLWPRELTVSGEEAKRAALQEEAMLLAVGGCERNRQVRDKAVQTNCKNQLIKKTSSESHSASVPGHKDSGVRDPVSQGALGLVSCDLNNFVTSTKNTQRKRHTKDVLSCDPCEQRLVKEQKSRTVGRRRKGHQQPRKAHRGRALARTHEQTKGKTCAFNSKCPQPPVSGSRSSPLEQQEPLAQPLHLCVTRSPTEPVCPALTPRRTAGSEQGTLLEPSEHFSQDNSQLSNSSKGDHKISWFSDLNLENSKSPSCKDPGKNVLYDLCFDSSDDSF